MSYVIVNGSGGNNSLAFLGIAAFYSETLVNPYSGYTITITGTKNINNAIYDGMGGTDTLSMTTLGDVLVLVDSLGTIMIKNVEIINAGDDGDIVILAHATESYGNVTIRGSNGDDLIWSNNGDDLLIAGNGDDIVDGGGGNDQIFGGTGDDYLAGGAGTEGLFGGAGDDTLMYHADAIWSGGYTLASFGSAIPFAALIALDGKNRSHDTFHGDLEQDLTVHTSGMDTLILTSGDDVLIINDTISPASSFFSPRVADIEVIEAGDGDDIVDLSGAAYGNVTINGGAGNDVLSSNSGNDVLNGDDGDDILFGGQGDDTLSGGADDDTYYYRIGDGNDTIIESAGTDTLLFGPGITLDSLAFETDGTDLKITVGGETITIQNHFASDLSGRVENLSFTEDGSVYDLGTYGPPAAPVATDDVFDGNEDEEITGNVLDNDSDANGDPLTVQPQTIVTANGGTVVLAADGSFSYIGAANYNGTDSFSYTVLDGNGGESTGNVALNIAAVNDDPVANDDVFTGNEDEEITGNLLLNDTDVDGDVLEVVAETLTTANGGSVTINADGTFSYIGASDFHGDDSFEYTAIDGHGGMAVGTVSLSVAAVNDAPVANDDVFTGNEDEEITGNLLLNDTDVDGDVLEAVAETLTTANGGSVTINADGTFSYIGASDFHGDDSFEYTVRDPSGATSTATALLSVAAVNDAPVANDDAFNGLRNSTLLGNVLDNDIDIDGDTLQVVVQTLTTAQGGTVSLNADGSFTYTPAAGFFGEDSFEYTALDGNGGFDAANVALTIALDPDESIIGTEDGEEIIGTSVDDEIFALGGDDVVKGMEGDDTIYGGEGNDVLYGDSGTVATITLDKSFADTITIPELKERVNIADLKPPGTPALGIAEGNLTVDFDATASITFRKGHAGYDNSFGSFGIAEDGTLFGSTVHWANVKTAGVDVTHQIDLPTGVNGGAFGFFVIADGNKANSGYSGLDITGEGNIRFVYNYGKASARDAKITDPGAKISIVYSDGVTTKVLKGNVYFTTERGEDPVINKDGKVHVVSGLRDTNNLVLDIKKADISGSSATLTKNGITLTASQGTLIASGDKVGIKSTQTGGNLISGTEALLISMAGSEKVIISLSDISGGTGAIDFKIYLDGLVSPVSYEHSTATASGGKIHITLSASDFGPGLITAVEVSSVANSSHTTETFYVDGVLAEIPGGIDTNQLRIGFEDLYNTGDADYEDVLFDLDINPVTVTVAEGGNDILDGGSGNDTLYGEGGDDILIFGLGADHVYGGAGADIFAITAIDNLIDTIHDFNAGEGDVINIADVLDGYDALSDDIAHFVQLVQNGANTELQINADGDIGGAFVTAALIIGGTGGDTLDSLISSGALVANQSAL